MALTNASQTITKQGYKKPMYIVYLAIFLQSCLINNITVCACKQMAGEIVPAITALLVQ